MTDKAAQIQTAQEAANTAETKFKGTVVRLEFSLLVKCIVESMIEYTNFHIIYINISNFTCVCLASSGPSVSSQIHVASNIS